MTDRADAEDRPLADAAGAEGRPAAEDRSVAENRSVAGDRSGAGGADRRARGREQMRAVYGWDFEPTTPFEAATVDHLFGEVWSEGDLSVKERRLLLVGLAIGTGQVDVAGLQLDAALALGELAPDDLRTITVFLAHYAGWPRAVPLNTEVEAIIARHATSAGDG